MSNTDKKKKLDLCYFKVPVSITEGDEGKVANFKEVEHRELCFKIETHEFETSQEAIAVSERMNTRNNNTLRIAALSKKDGDTVTRLILCDHDSVKVNNNNQ